MRLDYKEVLRGAGEATQRGSGMGEAGDPGDGEESVGGDRPPRVLPPRHRRREGGCQRGPVRSPRGLQVRGPVRRMDATRQGGAGFPGPRPRREDPFPRLDAEDHGAHGTVEPHYAGGSADPEGILAELQNTNTATTAVAISSPPTAAPL